MRSRLGPVLPRRHRHPDRSGLNQANYQAAQIASYLNRYYGDAEVRVTSVLTGLGTTATGIATTLHSVFGDTDKQVATAFQQAGLNQATIEAALANAFGDAGVLQWTWNGGHNQQWYVLPTDSGFAEIVNRNSGQCLAAPGYYAGQQLIHTPCTGNPGRQWYLGIYPGQRIQGQTKAIWNRATGLYADVSGASTSAGAVIDQWYHNGNWNQQWYFGPAVG